VESRHVIAEDLERLEHVVEVLAGYVRRTRSTDAELLRAIAEAEDLVRDLVADCGRPLDADDGPTESVTQYAARTGTPARTVRRWCKRGRLPARLRGGTWQIRSNGSIEHDGSTPRVASSRP
jgi:hypothetical protein